MGKEIIERIEDFALTKKATEKQFFTKVGLVGCGKEGQNIARIAARGGFEVVFVELSQERIDIAMEKIGILLDKSIKKWGLTSSEKRGVLSRISGSTDYSILKGCDIVIETIKTPEGKIGIEERKKVFKLVEENVSSDTIIATNTATIVVTALSSDLVHKERCLGLYFFVSSPEARFVEVVKGLYTSETACKKTQEFLTQINRRSVVISETSGLIGVRMFCIMINEACEILMQSISDKHTIDDIMHVAHGLRLGVFNQADRIGLDRIIQWMEDMYDEFGHVKYKPSPILKQLVRAGHIGVETKRGFYSYDENGKIIES